MPAVFLFWCCLFGAGYSYFVYPFVLLLLPKRSRFVPAGNVPVPSMSLIITARNENHRIRDKIVNALAIDYPADKLEIIVASDASDDGTDDIVNSFKERGVRLVRADVRRGKEYAQSMAIREARGEILVFSDVATRIPPGCLGLIAEDFSDPKVGAVSSEDRFVARDGRLAGEGAYVRYEMWVRRLESKVHSLVGLSGSFFAVRHDLCRDWDIKVPSDFNSALMTVRRNHVAVSDPRVVGIYEDIHDERREYQRKVRTVIRGLAAIARQPAVLNPAAVGFFAFQVWSHKVMRWLVPWFLVGLAVASVALAGMHWFYGSMTIGQAVFYLAAFAGWIAPRTRRFAAVKVPYFFVQANLAIAHATIVFVLGKRITAWEPSKR